MHQHLTNCAQFAEYLKFYALPDIDAVNTIVNKKMHLHCAVTEITEIIDHNENWIHLQYLEAYYIKTMSPKINIGLKASKNFNYSNGSHGCTIFKTPNLNNYIPTDINNILIVIYCDL